MATSRQSALLSDRYQTALATVARRAAAITAAAWTQLESVDEPAEDRYVRTVLPIVFGAQAQAVTLTDAYAAAYLTLELRQPVTVKGLVAVNLIGAHSRGGTPLEVVHRRPFGVVRGALAAGVAFAEAIERGRARATQTARTDVVLAARAAGSAWMADDDRVTGWRRQTMGRCCGLCASDADGRIIHPGDLMPIHPGCLCIVEPVAAGENSARLVAQPDPTVVDSPGLADEVDDPAVPNRSLVQVFDHGELGPVLYEAGHTFSDS